MAHITSNAATDDVFATWINRKFVSDLEYSLQHMKFTMKGTIQKGAGANILRLVDFAPPGPGAQGPVTSYTGTGTTALTEATITGNEITSVSTNPTNITVAEYGEFLKIGQLYEYASVEGTRERLRKRLLDGGNATLDSLVRVQAHTSTNLLCCTAVQTGGQTTITTATACGAAAIMQARKILFAGLCTGLSGVPGHPDGNFAAVITPLQELDIISEVTTLRVNWSGAVVNVPGAMGQEKWVKGYIGSIYGVSVYTTQNHITATNGTTNQIGYIYGDGGVGSVSYGDAAPEVIVNDVNSPYKNVNSIAWHAYFAAGLISSTRVVKMYSLGA